jgi:hypothetical protein
MKKKNTYLYVLLLPHMDEEYNLSYKVKFGYTENFDQRMKNGYEAYYGQEGYQVLHVYKGDFTLDDEFIIKQYLKDYTLFKNEWFKCCPEVLEFFATYNTTKKLKDKISTIPCIQPHRKYYKVNYHLVEFIISKAFPNLTELLDLQDKRAELSKTLRDYSEENQINYVCDTYKIIKEEVENYLLSKQIIASEKVTKLVKEFNNIGDTSKKLRMLVDLKNIDGVTEKDISSFLELIPPKFKEYYTIIGPDFIKQFSCNEAEIKKEWIKRRSNKTIDIASEIYKTFEVGKRYVKADIKETLKELYERLGYKKTAKASDLQEYFEVKKIYTSDKKNGFELLEKKGG